MFAIHICLKFESDNYKLIPYREQVKPYDFKANVANDSINHIQSITKVF
jgi:hypothetical protein